MRDAAPRPRGLLPITNPDATGYRRVDPDEVTGAIPASTGSAQHGEFIAITCEPTLMLGSGLLFVTISPYLTPEST